MVHGKISCGKKYPGEDEKDSGGEYFSSKDKRGKKRSAYEP